MIPRRCRTDSETTLFVTSANWPLYLHFHPYFLVSQIKLNILITLIRRRLFLCICGISQKVSYNLRHELRSFKDGPSNVICTDRYSGHRYIIASFVCFHPHCDLYEYCHDVIIRYEREYVSSKSESRHVTYSVALCGTHRTLEWCVPWQSWHASPWWPSRGGSRETRAANGPFEAG